MKHSYKIALTSIVATMLLSGCGMKPYAGILIQELPLKNDVSGKVYYVEGKEAWRSPSAGYNAKTRNIHILQNAADLTLNEGYSYFAINRPLELSNIDGNMINTAKEFIEKCTPPEGQVFDIGNARCGLNGSTVTAGIMIVAFKEAPKSTLTYNAKEVVNYLKQNELYRDDSYEINQEHVQKLFSKKK